MNIMRIACGIVLAFVAMWSAPASAATEITRVVSPGGIEAWLVEEHGIPILSVKMAFRGGASLDAPGQEGRANMVSGLLDEGAGKYDSQEFQARLEDLAIHLSFNAGLDTFSASLKTLSENVDAAFDMLRLALTEPRFDDDPVERIRGQIMVGLERSAEDPDSIVRRTWFRNAFPDHTYGRPVSGTLETVAALSADDLSAFTAAQFARDRLVIGVVGDITPKRLAALLDSTLGALPERAAPLTTVKTTPAAAGRLFVVERDIPQSIVVFGHAGISRRSPDYYAAYVMNHILGGGGFTSRLTNEVREKRGLAYGVYSYLAPMDHAALFMGRVATANARVAESLAVIRAEFERMAGGDITERELDDAKTYLTGSFPLRLDTNGKIAGLLVGIQLEDLGIDYLDKRNGYIDAVSLTDVNRIAKVLLRPDTLQVVVVGMPDGLEATN